MRAGRGTWPLRDIPVLIWVSATALVVVAHSVVPAPRWLMIHLLMLGAVSHAILVWSLHFTETLLHRQPSRRRDQSRRLLLLNGGVLTVVTGVVAQVWPVTMAGATAVATAVGWHGYALWRELRASLPARFAGTVRYYVWAAFFLPIGAALGTSLSRGVPDPWETRTVVAHAAVNLLGWVGLTVIGTLVTLWPTILRTRMADRAERAAARALPVLVTSIAAVVASSYLGSRRGVALALLGYVVGLVMTGRTFVQPLRRKPPVTFPALSVLAGMSWLVGSLLALAAAIGGAATWAGADAWVDRLAPLLVVGFAAQTLLGALSYLVPVALGGGPTPVRAANALVDRAGMPRVVATNAGLLLCALPVPHSVSVLAAAIVLGGLMSAIPLLLLAVRASRVVRTAATHSRHA